MNHGQLTIGIVGLTALLGASRGQNSDDPKILDGCRAPARTQALVRKITNSWDTWTLKKLRSFWPDELAALDDPRDGWASSVYGSIGRSNKGRGSPGCECCEIFHVGYAMNAKRGDEQYLTSVSVHYTADSLEDVVDMGKGILRAYGEPFEFLGFAYDPWILDEHGSFMRVYTWEEPKMSVNTGIYSGSGIYTLTIGYNRDNR